MDGLPPTPMAGSPGERSWPHRLSRLFSSCSSGSGGEDCAMEAAGQVGSDGGKRCWQRAGTVGRR